MPRTKQTPRPSINRPLPPGLRDSRGTSRKGKGKNKENNRRRKGNEAQGTNGRRSETDWGDNGSSRSSNSLFSRSSNSESTHSPRSSYSEDSRERGDNESAVSKETLARRHAEGTNADAMFTDTEYANHNYNEYDDHGINDTAVQRANSH